MAKLRRDSTLLFALAAALVVASGAAQTRPAAPGASKADDKARQDEGAKQKAGAEALKKYAGRYELEVGVLPVSTLDVTVAGGELWMKPSLSKKRRLIHKSKAVFTDEIEGTPVTFGRDGEGRVVGLTFLYEGEPYTARRVELPPPSLKGNTTFRLKGHADAAVVVLTGTFNGWNQSQLLFGREGDGWVCRVDLDPGVYQYKFVVDGDWLLDPSNPETVGDEAGNVNNVIEVRPQNQWPVVSSRRPVEKPPPAGRGDRSGNSRRAEPTGRWLLTTGYCYKYSTQFLSAGRTLDEHAA